MMKRFVLGLFAAAGLSACELTAEEQAALIQGLADGLNQAAYDTQYGSGYYDGGYGQGFNRAPSRRIRVCVNNGGRSFVTNATVRNGQALNQAVGGRVYRDDRDYVSLNLPGGTALVSIPAYASFANGPIYGRDQQGVVWRLSSPNRCY